MVSSAPMFPEDQPPEDAKSIFDTEQFSAITNSFIWLVVGAVLVSLLYVAFLSPGLNQNVRADADSTRQQKQPQRNSDTSSRSITDTQPPQTAIAVADKTATGGMAEKLNTCEDSLEQFRQQTKACDVRLELQKKNYQNKLQALEKQVGRLSQQAARLKKQQGGESGSASDKEKKPTQAKQRPPAGFEAYDIKINSIMVRTGGEQFLALITVNDRSYTVSNAGRGEQVEFADGLKVIDISRSHITLQAPDGSTEDFSI